MAKLRKATPILKHAVSTDKTREKLCQPFKQGKWLIATDGRRLAMLRTSAPFNDEGIEEQEEPLVSSVIPDPGKLADPKVYTEVVFDPYSLDECANEGPLMTLKEYSKFMKLGEFQCIELFRNDTGEAVLHYEGKYRFTLPEFWKLDLEPLDLNPKFLKEMLQFALDLKGPASIYFPVDRKSPLVMSTHNGHGLYLLMPMRTRRSES